jgi:hypothetical protein
LPKADHLGDLLCLATITLAWVLGPLAVADTAEVVWVSLQRWHGVTFHINNDTIRLAHAAELGNRIAKRRSPVRHRVDRPTQGETETRWRTATFMPPTGSSSRPVRGDRC